LLQGLKGNPRNDYGPPVAIAAPAGLHTAPWLPLARQSQAGKGGGPALRHLKAYQKPDVGAPVSCHSFGTPNVTFHLAVPIAA
jgi:hypothetical protein